MTKRSFVPLICVLLLLFSQQVAYTHAAWHAHEGAPTHEHSDDGDASLHSELCGLHGAFNQVLGGLQSGTLQLALPLEVADAITHQGDSCFALELRVPLSRGPPVLS